MGIAKKSAENLFISKVRIKALGYFLLNPNRPLHLRGAVREFNAEINAVRRELTRLESIRFLAVEDKGNRKYFNLNMEHPFVPELMSIFHKTNGLGGEIMENAKKLGEIDYAFLTPAFTKGFYYGTQVVDLVVIGSVDMNNLSLIIIKQEDKLQREVHYTVLTSSADVRVIFNKGGGSLGNAGAVKHLFHRKGHIVIPKTAIGEDDLMSLVLDAGAEDMVTQNDAYEITTDPMQFEAVHKAIEEKYGIKPEAAEVGWFPLLTRAGHRHINRQSRSRLDRGPGRKRRCPKRPCQLRDTG